VFIRDKSVVVFIISMSEQNRIKSIVKLSLFITSLAVIIIAIKISGIDQFLEKERLQNWISGFGSKGPIAYMLLFSLTPSLFLPGLPITVAGGIVFGALWGTIYASIGSTIGACLAFLIARYFARNQIENLLSGRLKAIDEGVEKNGWIFLHEQLKSIDPVSAARIHANDAQRIQRALEIYTLTHQTPTQLFEQQQKENKKFNFVSVILSWQDKEILNQKIEQRFDHMLTNGFIEEVEKLFHRGDLNENLPSIRMVGYQEIWQYLAGKYDQKTMREKAIIATRQLAKHQMTWLKRWENAHWLDAGKANLCESIFNHLKLK